MSSSKLKVNLYGEAWKLKHLIIPDEFMEIIENYAKIRSVSITDVIADPFFYHKLQNKKIQSVEDWEGISTEGLMNTQINNIEIWFKNKKVAKLKINDLNDELLLFPLYNSVRHTSNAELNKGFYLEQKEIGKVGSFTKPTNDFILDDLAFHLLQKNNEIILESIIYKDVRLTNSKKDTLITFQNCFEIK